MRQHVTPSPARSLVRALPAVLAAAVLVGAACQGQPGRPDRKRIQPVYDKKTGVLQLLKYDSNGNGRIDTWSYMDGARIVRIEIDRNEDGRIDRWEYYTPDRKLEKVGWSRADNGSPDAWGYPDATGRMAKIELTSSPAAAGSAQGGTTPRIVRTEYYEGGLLARAEEDTDGDGRIDKWETYDGARLASVAFDVTRSGRPERRLVYGTDGTVRAERIK